METNKTQYLVTGAAGFLGSVTCRQLIAQGYKVRAFILPNDPARSLFLRKWRSLKVI